MSLGGGDVPQSPTSNTNTFIDPFALANTQQAFNTGSAVANQAGSMPNMTTPGWNQDYVQVGTGPGGIPLYQTRTILNGQNANNYNTYMNNQATAGGMVPSLANLGATQLGNSFNPYQDAGNLQQGVTNMLTQGFAAGVPARGHLDAGSQHLSEAAQVMGGYMGQDPNAQLSSMTSGITGQRMDAALAGVRPEQQFQRNTLDTQLRNQGLHPGQPGYDNAMRQLDTSQNLANNSFMAQFQPEAFRQATQIFENPAQKAAMLAGLGGQYLQQAAPAYGNLASTFGGLGSQYGALSNAATNLGQAWGNQGLSTMSQALPWLAASAPQMPGAPQGASLGIQPTNLGGIGTAFNAQLGNNYQNQLAGYNAQLAQQQNMMSGLFGIGSSVLGGLAAGGFFSDRRLKENIEPIGVLPNGIPVYTFNYKFGGPTIIGPMADEVEKFMPEAVHEVGGYKLVDYRMVMP